MTNYFSVVDYVLVVFPLVARVSIGDALFYYQKYALDEDETNEANFFSGEDFS